MKTATAANTRILLTTQIVVPSIKRIDTALNSDTVTVEFNREVAYINTCLSLADQFYSALTESEVKTQYDSQTPVEEDIASIYDDTLIEDSSCLPKAQETTPSIVALSNYRKAFSVNDVSPDTITSITLKNKKILTITLPGPITTDRLDLRISGNSFADSHSRQIAPVLKYTVDNIK